MLFNRHIEYYSTTQSAFPDNRILALGPYFLQVPQIFENRNFLRNPDSNEKLVLDTPILLPPEPVIWAANHAFKDDALATILAAKRHAYILFGSLPQI